MSLHIYALGQVWEYPYIQYTKYDGFKSNTVYSVCTDHQGNLWVGSDAGIFKFDGHNLKYFNTSNGLPSNDVFELFCDKQDRIWITTFKNEISYIYRDAVYTPSNSNLLSKIEGMTSLPRYFEDSQNNIWIQTSPFRICYLDTFNTIHYIKEDLGIANGGNLTELNGKLYLVSFFNTVEFDLSTKKSRILKSSTYKLIDGLAVFGGKCYYINQDNELTTCDTSVLTKGEFKAYSLNWKVPIIDSNVWINNQKGFKVYNLSDINDDFTVVGRVPVSFIHKDFNGNLWLASLNHGLFKITSMLLRNLYTTNSITSVYVDGDDLYYGTADGEVFRVNSNSPNEFKRIPITYKSLTSVRVIRITKFENTIYFVTDRGAWKFNSVSNSTEKIAFYHNALKGILIKNDTLMLLDNDGIRYYNRKSNSCIDSIINYKRYYSYCEYKGRKVVGSQDSLYYLSNHRFVPYPLNRPFNYRPIDLQVKDSLLLATTAEGGVFMIKDSQIVKELNISNGLSSNSCYRSLLDRELLFIATNNGINVYDFTTDSVYHLFESDGLPSNSVFDLSIQNDTLFAATENGLSIIPVSAISHFKTFPLFVQPVVINNDTVWSDKLQYDFHTDQQVTFIMNALSFGTKSPVRFFYKIKNRDSIYRFTQDQQLIVNTLPVGNHELEIYAVNSEGTRSTTLLLSLTVVPYFYQTLFFKFLMAALGLICFALIIWQVIRQTRAREKKKNELENKIRGLEISAWKSAINPHFLFNSLNTAQALFRINDFRRANDYLSEFSGIMRKTLDQSGRLMILVSDEVAYLQNYLELERIKRNNQLTYSIRVEDDALLPYYIPSLVIQPIIENALKHGIKDREDGLVEVHFTLQQKQIECRITDNGVGFPTEVPGRKEGSRGLGLIWSKLNIVEKLVKKPVQFRYGNRLNDKGEVLGTESIFIFPFINFDYDLSQYHYR